VTNTVYATSDTLGEPFLGRTVYMIDGRTCAAKNMSGCGHSPAKIPVGSAPGFGDANPFGIAVDQATDTIYTADIFNGEGLGARHLPMPSDEALIDRGNDATSTNKRRTVAHPQPITPIAPDRLERFIRRG
jgi:hypothetical protein